jgi:hypothetical protein
MDIETPNLRAEQDLAAGRLAAARAHQAAAWVLAGTYVDEMVELPAYECARGLPLPIVLPPYPEG